MGCMLIFVYHHGHFHLHCFAFVNNDELTYSVQHKAANILILRINLNQIKRQFFGSDWSTTASTPSRINQMNLKKIGSSL